MNSRCLSGFSALSDEKQLIGVLRAEDKHARLCTQTHCSLSWRVTISVDKVRENWMKGERQRTEEDRSFCYSPLIRQLQSQEQHISCFSVYYLSTEPHSHTERKAWNSPDLVTYNILESTDSLCCYLLIAEKYWLDQAYRCFMSITQESIVKLEQGPKTQLNYT